MAGIAHALIAAAQMGLAVFGMAGARRNPSLAIGLVVAVVLGLAYDNAVLALGAVLDAGALLEALNTPRYWVHGLLTPTIIWVAITALALAGHPVGRSRLWRGSAGVLTIAMIGLGAWIDAIGLDLQPTDDQGITRYVNGFEPLAGPPLASVVTILVVLVAGTILWRRNRWPWLAVGATVMFISAAIPGPILLIQGLGEVAFAAGLIATLTHGWDRATESSSPAHASDIA